MGKYLYTRDLAKRLEELRDQQAAHNDMIEDLVELSEMLLDESYSQEEHEAQVERREDLESELNSLTEDELEELEELENMEREIPEWGDGNTLVPEEDFEDYCKELCEDIGDSPSSLPDYIAIDWSATANNLRVDYSEIEYQGDTYLYRS